MTPRTWRPALRMARRDLRRHRRRSLLTLLLVALPVVCATVVALLAYNNTWTRETAAEETLLEADAVLQVARRGAVATGPDVTWLDTSAVPGSGRRDPASVDVAALLPSAARLVRWHPEASAPLASGGRLHVHFTDLEDPVFGDDARLEAGQAPQAPDEIALPAHAADELGLLVDGVPREDAVLELADGSTLQVTGVVQDRPGFEEGLDAVAPLDSRLAVPRRDRVVEPRYLVELPDMDREAQQSLRRDLAAAGVASVFRDAVLHPEEWAPRHYGSFDEGGPAVEHLVVGSVVMLVGALEVVLLVGAAFAVAARRHVRDLGLLAANGGAAADLRRVLLAQGLVVGTVGSVLGVGLGVLAFRQGVPVYEELSGSLLPRQEVDPWSLVVVGLLGVLSAVVAALLPAWTTARLTPVAALSGRFPVRRGEARAHRGAFVLAGVGLLLLAGGGWATARVFAPRGSENPLPPFVAGLGLLLLVAGAVWATPYVVRQVARTGSRLPLSGRYAFRDAGRHRVRSAAAVVALTITVAGAVLSGFAFASLSAAQEREGDWLPPNAAEVYGSGDLDRLVATVEDVHGPVRTVVTRDLVVGRSTPTAGGRQVGVTDAASLTQRVTPADRRLATEALAAGDLVVLGGSVRGGDEARLRVGRGDRDALRVDRLPVTVVDPVEGPLGSVERFDGGAYVDAATARALGGRPGYRDVLLLADTPFTQEVVDRLAVYGIGAASIDPDRLRVEQMQYLGLVAAGLASLVVVGVAVAMATAESRDDVATLVAVGAGPWRRRSIGAGHGLFLALVGAGLGVLVGTPAGLAFTQVDGLPGADLPWLAASGTVAATLVGGAAAGWVVSPSRLRLTRRTA